MKLAVDDLELAYQVHGDGPPLLLLTGLGYAAWAWYKQLPELAACHRVLVLDNRGAGDSDKPDVPYTIARMADDAAALLDHLSLARADVLGVSMGGYIAQELALRHPTRVRRLVLGCTGFGGPDAPRMSDQTAAQLRAESAADASPEIAAAASPEITPSARALRFSDRYAREQPGEVTAYFRIRHRHRPPAHAWLRQAAACANFDASARIGELRAPTLVATGDDDPIVPAANSRLLAARIAGAELVLYPGARHLFFLEEAVAFNRHVIRFLAREP